MPITQRNENLEYVHYDITAIVNHLLIDKSGAVPECKRI